MKNILFVDVDGVVRDIQKVLFKDVEKWEDWTDETNKIIAENKRDILFTFPRHSFHICRLLCEIEERGKGIEVKFLTNQCGDKEKEFWTTEWLKKHFKGLYKNIIYVDSFEKKLSILKDNKNAILLDDYPYFYNKDNFNPDQIFLFKQKWNDFYTQHYKYVVEEKYGLTVRNNRFSGPDSTTAFSVEFLNSFFKNYK